MSVASQERTLTLTTHYTVPAFPKVIHVPAHFSLDETREAIHAEISKHIPDGCLTQPSSIVIASGEQYKEISTHFN